jgi:hypothetical protein
MSDNISSEKLQLLRIFKYIDSLPPYESSGCRRLSMDNIVIDGKKADELNSQIEILSNKEKAFTCSGPFIQTMNAP